MRKTQRLISLGLGLTLSLLTAWPAAAQTEPPVNINSADAKTLARAIDGLSLKQAEAIVAFRDAHGPFESFDELVKVDGVGWSLLKANGLTRRPPKEFRDADAESGTAVSKARVGL
jgi:competence protein ComEA